MDTVNEEPGNIFDPTCRSRDTLELISSKWTVLALYALQNGTLRYSEVKKKLPGVTQKVLTTTLRRLEKDGLVTREIKPVIPPWVEYNLTPLGMSLMPVLGALTAWSERHYREVLKSRDLRTYPKSLTVIERQI